MSATSLIQLICGNLYYSGILFPVPIKRKLRPIVELFTDDTFQVRYVQYTYIKYNYYCQSQFVPFFFLIAALKQGFAIRKWINSRLPTNHRLVTS